MKDQGCEPPNTSSEHRGNLLTKRVFYTWSLECVEIVPFHPKNLRQKGRHFTYLEDPGQTRIAGKLKGFSSESPESKSCHVIIVVTTWMSRWKLGSMVSKWVISYNLLINGVYCAYSPLILPFYKNFQRDIQVASWEGGPHKNGVCFGCVACTFPGLYWEPVVKNWPF